MGLVCSGCYCNQHMGGKCYAWDNLKCKLINAAQRRHAKKACRCVRRRPKCLRIRRRRNFQCTCNHGDCQLGLNKPPIPLGCGPPLAPVCSNTGSPILRSAIPRPVQAVQTSSPQAVQTSSSHLPPCVRTPSEIPPCARPPCGRNGGSFPCGENPPCGRPPCMNSASPVMVRVQSPTRRIASKTVSTDAPKSLRTVSKTVNTEVLCPVGRPKGPEKKEILCPVGRSRSPVKKEVVCPVGRSRTPEKKVATKVSTRSVSSSPEPPEDEGNVVVRCGCREQSPDHKCCRFTVDAYFN